MDEWELEYERTHGAARHTIGHSNHAGPASLDRARDSAARDDDRLDIDELMAPSGIQNDEARFEPASQESPVQQLIRHWMNERHAPDILPVQEHLLAGILDHIRRQSEAIQLLRSDPSSSEEEHFRITLVQTEVERIKFIVRSYLRIRLFKIEKHARFITSDPDIQTRISAAERTYASRSSFLYFRPSILFSHPSGVNSQARILDQHYWVSVLQSLPEAQAHLDDTPLFMPSMITKPDKSRAVFVHALKRCPPVQLPDGTTLEMSKGHISLVPFYVVEHLVLRGEVELV